MNKEKTEETSFETSLKKLEEAVEKLEAGDLPLDDALRLFEEGLKASNACRSRLEDAKQRVDVLVKEHGGDFSLMPFDSDDEATDEQDAPF